MWCTLALTVSLIVFVLSWQNMRDTKENLRDAQQLIDKLLDALDEEGGSSR